MTLMEIFDRMLGVRSRQRVLVDVDSEAAMRDTNRQVDEIRREFDEMDAYVHAQEVSVQASSRGMILGNEV